HRSAREVPPEKPQRQQHGGLDGQNPGGGHGEGAIDVNRCHSAALRLRNRDSAAASAERRSVSQPWCWSSSATDSSSAPPVSDGCAPPSVVLTLTKCLALRIRVRSSSLYSSGRPTVCMAAPASTADRF